MEDVWSERCFQCFRPLGLCFCHAIPKIDNRTDILILQHVGERFHPFNTARIVRRALRRCRLIVGHNQRLGAHPLPIQAGAGVLYPCDNAISLADVPDHARPSQLVVVDGTWRQAQTIVRDVPQLEQLPRFRLAPTSPGRYRIRREPNEHSLSTLEAMVAALRALEPGTEGLDQLLSAFDIMVEDQLKCQAAHSTSRQNKRRQLRPRGIPHALLQRRENLVVAYGEAAPNQPGRRAAERLPVNWVAQRLGDAERFSCLVRQRQPLETKILQHMRVSASEFDSAIAEDEFGRQWRRFLRRNDTLIAYHQRTLQLLPPSEVGGPRRLVLKSIFKGQQDEFCSLEELMLQRGLQIPPAEPIWRAHQRLDMAVALVEQLRLQHLGRTSSAERLGAGLKRSSSR